MRGPDLQSKNSGSSQRFAEALAFAPVVWRIDMHRRRRLARWQRRSVLDRLFPVPHGIAGSFSRLRHDDIVVSRTHILTRKRRSRDTRNGRQRRQHSWRCDVTHRLYFGECAGRWIKRWHTCGRERLGRRRNSVRRVARGCVQRGSWRYGERCGLFVRQHPGCLTVGRWPLFGRCVLSDYPARSCQHYHD